eukprot:4231113-Pleurochrysis_carterae.AAC.2
MSDSLCSAYHNACSDVHMPCEAILHAQKSEEVPVITHDTGQTIFKCPESVPARAATSQERNAVIYKSKKCARARRPTYGIMKKITKCRMPASRINVMAKRSYRLRLAALAPKRWSYTTQQHMCTCVRSSERMTSRQLVRNRSSCV